MRILAVGRYDGGRDVGCLAAVQEGLALAVGEVGVGGEDGGLLEHVLDGYFVGLRLLGMVGLALIVSGRGAAPEEIQDRGGGMSNEKTRVGLGLVLGRGLSLQIHDNNARPNKINEGEKNEQRAKGEGVDWEGVKVEGFCCF